MAFIPASADVSSGQLATATQYNILRDDVLEKNGNVHPQYHRAIVMQTVNGADITNPTTLSFADFDDSSSTGGSVPKSFLNQIGINTAIILRASEATALKVSCYYNIQGTGDTKTGRYRFLINNVTTTASIGAPETSVFATGAVEKTFTGDSAVWSTDLIETFNISGASDDDFLLVQVQFKWDTSAPIASRVGIKRFHVILNP